MLLCCEGLYTFEFVCVLLSDFACIPDDLNMSQTPLLGLIYSHADMQRWNPQQSLRSSVTVQTDLS